MQVARGQTRAASGEWARLSVDTNPSLGNLLNLAELRGVPFLEMLAVPHSPRGL
jgi:hypothetical protein